MNRREKQLTGRMAKEGLKNPERRIYGAKGQ